ncbi:MAG: hypothetical protein KKG47_14785 [Proteobacteria bacterium]|nr:hypothetical protein [Pseudomonadota bacterium]MBU1739842.1 hypothetical protein [Pseudomonadota bacterium]
MNEIPMNRQNRTIRQFATLLLALLSFLIASTAPVFSQESALDKLKNQPASLKTKELKVKTLLQAIGRQGGINIYVDDKIDDTIDIDMENLTLYEVFQVVVEAKNLHYAEKNGIIFIERETDFQKGFKDVITDRFCTSFGNAKDHVEKLKPFLDKGGSLTVTNRGNCLIVRDRSENVARVKQILAELDQPVPQVHIEARIVSISQDAKRQLGIKWGYDNLKTNNPVSAASDLSISGSSNLAVGFIRDNLDLSIDLQALQEDDKLKILSAPRILVMDGQQALIKQGKEVPYVTQSGDLINTSFREANLSLQVTPRVLRDNYIVLDVVVTNDSVDQTNLVGSEPLINKQSITTNLFLEDDVTVVIGGILLQSEDSESGRVPGLSSIPLLGNLFKNSSTNKEKSELLVFITPRIINMSPMFSEVGTPVVESAVADSSEPQGAATGEKNAPQEGADKDW